MCAPVNWPLFPRPDGERAAEIVRVQANAAVNRMFIAACDRSGTESGVRWTEGTTIVDPDGFPIGAPIQDHPAQILTAECGLPQARNKRIGGHNDVLADRRPDLYQPILTSTPPT